MSQYKGFGNYDLEPKIHIKSKASTYSSWQCIFSKLWQDAQKRGGLLILDCYQGVLEKDLLKNLQQFDPKVQVFHTKDAFFEPQKIAALVQQDVTNDAIFGYITRLTIKDYFSQEKKESLQQQLVQLRQGQSKGVLMGVAASLFAEKDDTLVYLDMARWEIQQRQRQGLLSNIGVDNRGASAKEQYKHSYFVDWRVLDRHKQEAFLAQEQRWHWVIDCNFRKPLSEQQFPKMLKAKDFFIALKNAVHQPFRLVPFFDPGVWGGQWMREVCGLHNYRRNSGANQKAPNYAWCFDCVPEENSFQFMMGEETFEFPALNLVFYRAEKLLGEAVHARFGKEFPIRFDFLDTMGGQNLSFQVHPRTEYIQQHFGMHYTQDESYYILDADEGAIVYLGLQEDTEPKAMLEDLKKAQESSNTPFPAEKHVNTIPVEKHDHFLIPAATPHCSGAGSMVLEISATPYIFTFKLWDWGRVDLDGQPRAINLAHGEKNIAWERRKNWVKKNIVNRFQDLEGEELCGSQKAEKTGLHEREFISTRRYWFNALTHHDTGGQERGSVHVLNLIAGKAALIKSPENAFSPFEVHYAETFIVPAVVGCYTIEPVADEKCAVIQASVRLGVI